MMHNDESADPNTLRLERYLSGALPSAEVDRLLDELAGSPPLRDRLDALRAHGVTDDEFATALDAFPSTVHPPLAEVSRLTPPYTFEVSGGRQHSMGAGTATYSFGPSSNVELLLRPVDIDEHLPVQLLLADESGALHESGVEPRAEGEVVVLSAKGRDLFPAAGRWTLCVVVGTHDTPRARHSTLEALRVEWPPSFLSIHPIRYESD